jgi:hypothetical protein
VKEDSSSRLIPYENAVKGHVVSISVEDANPSITAHVDGEVRNLIIGTGSTVSILQPGLSRSDVSVTVLKPFGVTGEVLDVKGRQVVSLEIGGREFRHTFLVCSLSTDAAGLIGTEFLLQQGIVMDLQCNKLSFVDVESTSRARNDTPTGCTALAVFTEGKEGHSPQPSPRKARRKDEQFPAGPAHEGGSVRDRMWLVRAKENITIAPRCQQVVLAKLDYKKERETPSLVCIEPAQVPIEGVFPARALTRVGSNDLESPHATQRADRVETRHSNGRVHVLLANFTKETLTIPKATVLGISEEVSEQLVDEINPGNKTDLQAPPKPPRQKKKEVLYDKLLQSKLDNLNQEDRLNLESILRKFAHVFMTKIPTIFQALMLSIIR